MPTIKISYEVNSCIVTFEHGSHIIEGYGYDLATALYDLASEVEMDGYTLNYLREVSGVTF